MIITGDCLEVMKTLDAGSIDAIVTDPPYGLSFMGKDWDKGVPGEAFWREALRVAKPGCHLLAAGGTRTFHRLAVAIEDAGWDIRDCVMWIYGSGFPKSHNVSLAIDKAQGAKSDIVGSRQGNVFVGGGSNGYGGAGWSSNRDDYAGSGEILIKAPHTDAAKQWQGWGTALKPAWEPFILARKPLAGTVAANVLTHGTGGINVDGCRVGSRDDKPQSRPASDTGVGNGKTCYGTRKGQSGIYTAGRWPANVIHDDSEVVDFMGKSARFFYTAKASRSEREAGLDGMKVRCRLEDIGNKRTTVDRREGRQNNTKVRNHHPTVKPVSLMRYLCKLITPPNATILDPFCGSGSTGVAAIREGFNFIGIELSPEYAEIATRRIEQERSLTPLLEAIK